MDGPVGWAVARPYDEFGATAVVDPEAAAVDAPCLPWIQAEPLIWRDSWASRRPPMSHQFLFPLLEEQVTRLRRSVAGLCVRKGGYCEGGCEKKSRNQEEFNHACHLSSFELKSRCSPLEAGALREMTISGDGLLVQRLWLSES